MNNRSYFSGFYLAFQDLFLFLFCCILTHVWLSLWSCLFLKIISSRFFSLVYYRQHLSHGHCPHFLHSPLTPGWLQKWPPKIQYHSLPTVQCLCIRYFQEKRVENVYFPPYAFSPERPSRNRTITHSRRAHTVYSPALLFDLLFHFSSGSSEDRVFEGRMRWFSYPNAALGFQEYGRSSEMVLKYLDFKGSHTLNQTNTQFYGCVDQGPWLVQGHMAQVIRQTSQTTLSLRSPTRISGAFPRASSPTKRSPPRPMHGLPSVSKFLERLFPCQDCENCLNIVKWTHSESPPHRLCWVGCAPSPLPEA